MKVALVRFTEPMQLPHNNAAKHVAASHTGKGGYIEFVPQIRAFRFYIVREASKPPHQFFVGMEKVAFFEFEGEPDLKPKIAANSSK